MSGRKDDMIVSGGENIYPLEIEQAISEAAGDAEAKVIGIEDEKWGQRPIAFVISSAELDIVALKAKLTETLARYKVPDQIIPLKEWPLTTTGKVDLKKLAEFYSSAKEE